ncbi:hypothetical protein [Aeromonas sp. 159]|uniref:hypothetical protein n=1 Tax=Aeromonas sp. 159 TaxID=1216961 RepID=UPI0003016F8F|nr:hypothetical protein [Aeromonas sp. 159]
MNKHYLILCVDDEREVLDAVIHDLAPFRSHFELEAAESVDEARAVVDASGGRGVGERRQQAGADPL